MKNKLIECELPLVSVVIPTYNRAGTIHKTLQSVLEQTIQCFEVIIVDDCSDDYIELATYIEQLNDSRIRLLRHEVNRHGSAARNTGINVALGKYVALLDSDDLWYKNKLEKCIEKNIGQGEVLYSKLINQDGCFPRNEIEKQERVADYLFLNQGCMQTSTLFLTTVLAQKVLFDESLTRFQDYDFVIRLQVAGATFTMIDETLVQMLDYGDGARISNNINYQPAIFWLDKIIDQLSTEAATAFYYNRVVRLMVISSNQSKLFELLPD